jgi:hypothetical protein
VISATKVFTAVILAAIVLAFIRSRSAPKETVFEPTIRQVDSQNPCAWNDAETGLTNWFPGATGYVVQDVILSGKRIPLQEQLGRPLRPEEMLLHCYLVQSNEANLGTVLTRRFKGEHGAIEFALALDNTRQIRHFKTQRIREPAEIVNALDQLDLDARLQNKKLGDDLVVPSDKIPPAAQALASRMGDEIKTLLVLYEAGCTEAHVAHHH